MVTKNPVNANEVDSAFTPKKYISAKGVEAALVLAVGAAVGGTAGVAVSEGGVGASVVAGVNV